ILHTNIVVQNLDRTLRFYRDLLGFKVVVADNAGMTDDPKLAVALGIKERVKMRWALIRLGDDNNAPFLDVEQWLVPEAVDGSYPSCNHVGICRIALQVTDIDKTYNDLKADSTCLCSSAVCASFRRFSLTCFCTSLSSIAGSV